MGRQPDIKRNKRKKRLWRFTDTILVIIAVICAVVLLANILEGILLRRQEEELRGLAVQEKETQRETEIQPETEKETGAAEDREYVSPIDFEGLGAVNSDIVAWIEIPGTDISYPVVQAEDNEKYLKRDFEGGASAAGTIFLDCDSDSDLMGLHSIFYGHHMKNKTMFAQIVKFKEETFFKENREVILYTPEAELHLRTIAAVYGNADGEKRRTQFDSQEMFNRYVDEMTRSCSFRELPEKDISGLYSFVTCSYEFQDARTILYAVREEIRPSHEADAGIFR